MHRKILEDRREIVKVRKFTVALLLCLTLVLCASTMLQPANAKATKTQFTGKISWAEGASDPVDRYAGQTTHRRDRMVPFNIIETDSDLFDGTLIRIANFNRNDHKGFAQRWGTFEILSEGVLLWKGSWTGRASEGRTENYVGHGVGALKGLQIKFTAEFPGIFVTGFILNPHE
jgi:hypothetical protein